MRKQHLRFLLYAWLVGFATWFFAHLIVDPLWHKPIRIGYIAFLSCIAGLTMVVIALFVQKVGR